MAVIDLQRNHVGVQSVNSQFANYSANGQGALLHHTDGYIYCIFARNYLNTTFVQRRLYMTRTNDAGLTWSDAIEISSGYWDDDPAIIQLDVEDTGAHIGVVFNRAARIAHNAMTAVLTRVVINKETGAAETPYDSITGSPETKKWPSVLAISSGFIICCIAADSIRSGKNYVYQYTNSSFTTNDWVQTTKTVFPANQQGMSLSVKKLSNGHLAMTAAYRTTLDGSVSAIEMGNLPAGILKCDVGIFFSDDEGSTWTAVQKLSNYTGTPQLDLEEMLSVASVDLEQLSDGRIVVAYQEHAAAQFISPDTALTLPATIDYMTDARYHAGHNMILCVANAADDGGLFVIDLTAQTVIRIHTGSDPALWTNHAESLDLSADENQLAVGLGDGGICILDVSDADPANWTIVKELRTVSTPALLSDVIYKMRWDGNTVLYFSYAAVTGAYNWGGRYDTGDDSLVTLKTSHNATKLTLDFVVTSTKIVVVHSGSNRIESVNKTTGAAEYYSVTTYGNEIIIYDDVNDKFLCLVTTTMTRIIDTGTAFTEEVNYTPTSNPAWAGVDSNYYLRHTVEVPGKGFFCFNSGSYTSGYLAMWHWYSFAGEQPTGFRVCDWQSGLGENMSHYGTFRGCSIKNTTWLAMPRVACIIFQNLENVGRIRYGFFGYDSDTKQLVTTDVDFYDVCNSLKVGTNLTKLQFPKFCRDNDDRFYFYFNRWDIDQFAPVLGIVEPDVVKLTVLARIRNTYTATVHIRSRIRNTYTSTFSARMRIVFAQCIKIRARIVPRQTATLTIRGAIKNRKSSTCTMSFYAQKTNATAKLRVKFWSNTGYNRTKTMTVKSRIIQTYSCRITGHFIVPRAGAATNLNFSLSGTWKQTLSARARIVGG
jgi:hypothetical protein